ncbi:MAG: VOC family protein [Chloroflexota bacterium]
MKLDHIVVAVDSLERAIQDYRALGFTVVEGGTHGNQATHNALIFLSDGTYIELMAATGNEPLAGVFDFSPLTQQGEGFVGYALLCDDIEFEAKRLQSLGFETSDIVTGQRRNSGRLLEWKMCLIDNDFTPFLIQDVTPREWRVQLSEETIHHPNRAIGMPAVELLVREMDTAWTKYCNLLNIRPESTASNYRTVGPVRLHAYTPELASSDDATLSPFAGRPPQEDEALYAVHLRRDSDKTDAFTLQRSHGVRFKHKS